MSFTRTLFLAMAAHLAFAQEAPKPKVHKIGGITVTGSFRTRVESWDWFEPSSGDPNYTYSGSLLRLNLSQAKEKFSWTTEFAIPVLLHLPDNAVAPGAQGAMGMGANYFTANNRNTNAAMFFPKQAYVQWKGVGGAGGQLRLGRVEFADGSETAPKNATLAALKTTRINMRLLGHFGWTHIGRSFDGLHYSRNSMSKSAVTGNFTFLGAIPTRGVFQTDGWGWNQIAFGYAAYTKPWGKGTHTADTRVFALYYQDWRSNVLKTDNRAAAARRLDTANVAISTFGGHSIHAIETKPATFDILFWGAAQTGRWGVQDHRAYAYDAEAGFQPKAQAVKKLKPWFRGGYGQSSGDNNTADGTHNTFFQILPTPRPFARFPFFNMMNNRDIYAGLTLRPHPRLSISNEFHSLSLANRNDLWYVGGGVFQPWSFGYVGRATNGARSLANLYDASVDVKLNAQVSLNLYYGRAQGLAAIKSIYPSGRSANLGYVELMYKF
ncbi:MAG: alginate export family protein [Acidobacteria bacterium]|nr:alginate export family protein [Acidobacteriota bacterium]